MFIVTSVVKIGSNPNVNQLGEWKSKLWYIHAMEYDSALKRSELLIHTITWMNLKGMMLSESNEIPKVTFSTIAFI